MLVKTKGITLTIKALLPCINLCRITKEGPRTTAFDSADFFISNFQRFSLIFLSRRKVLLSLNDCFLT